MTSQELWDKAEADYDRAIESCVPEVERRLDAAMLLDLSLRAHASAMTEQKRSMHAINMAVRRAQRARRHMRRAELLLVRAAKLHAITHERPLTTIVNEALVREAGRE